MIWTRQESRSFSESEELVLVQVLVQVQVQVQDCSLNTDTSWFLLNLCWLSGCQVDRRFLQQGPLRRPHRAERSSPAGVGDRGGDGQVRPCSTKYFNRFGAIGRTKMESTDLHYRINVSVYSPQLSKHYILWLSSGLALSNIIKSLPGDTGWRGETSVQTELVL